MYTVDAVNERILVVEDERGLNRMVGDYLSALGFTVDSVFDGPEALRRVRAHAPDLIVLDLMLPGLDGLDVARRIREDSTVPIIMLTARAEEADKLIGLELGADDYLTKPFSLKELAARMRAVLRRTRHAEDAPDGDGQAALAHLDLRLDPARRLVTRAGSPVPLTAVQFDILHLLLRHPGRVFTRLEILEAVQGISHEGYERTVDVHVKNLRKALEPDPARPAYLLTVWGVGYKLAERAPPAPAAGNAPR